VNRPQTRVGLDGPAPQRHQIASWRTVSIPDRGRHCHDARSGDTTADSTGRFAWRYASRLLPSGRGASDKAVALFSFPSLATYEQYRALFGTDPEFLAADRIRDESNCVLRYERTFMRPLLPGH
jgi:hypothetical protein